MSEGLFRYTFGSAVPREEVEGTLTLVWLAVAGLHGEGAARLEAAHYFDCERVACVIDVRGPAGRDANVLFLSFLTREFGADAFSVERITRRRPLEGSDAQRPAAPPAAGSAA